MYVCMSQRNNYKLYWLTDDENYLNLNKKQFPVIQLKTNI